MKTLKILLVSFLIVLCLSSCERDKRGGTIRFVPKQYTISAAGGEVVTSVGSQHFMISGTTIPTDTGFPTFFEANEDGTFLEADFFTAERTADYRIKFIVEPNTTGQERTRYVRVGMLDDGGGVDLIQTAN